MPPLVADPAPPARRSSRAGAGPALDAEAPPSVPALRWMAEQYAVRLDVLRHVLDRDRPLSVARTRAVVDRWQRAGLVEVRRLLADSSPFTWPTAAGLRAVGVSGRATPLRLGLLAHVHAVSLVRLGIERAGGAWTSERALYRERSTVDAHVADARFRIAGGLDTAVEVELTPKGADRLRRIIDDLTMEHDAVLYVVDGARVRAAVERAADALAEQARVFVVELCSFQLTASRR